MRRRLISVLLALSLLVVGVTGCAEDIVGGDIIPTQDNTFDIGAPGLSWAEIHAYDYYMYGNMETDFDPEGAGLLDSGDAVDYWDDIYANSFWAGTDVELTSSSGNLTVDGHNLARPSTFVVAANDASAQFKAQADYVCDGTGDQVEILAAINALPADGGKIILSDGTFSVNANMDIDRNYVTICGQGMYNTVLTTTTNGVIIIYANGNSYLHIKDLTVYGYNDGANEDLYAIYFYNHNYCILENIEVTNSGSEYAIYWRIGNYNQLVNVYNHNNETVGIYARDENYLRIDKTITSIYIYRRCKYTMQLWYKYTRI